MKTKTLLPLNFLCALACHPSVALVGDLYMYDLFAIFVAKVCRPALRQPLCHVSYRRVLGLDPATNVISIEFLYPHLPRFHFQYPYFPQTMGYYIAHFTL